MEKQLEDGDYELVDGAAWFTVKKASVRISSSKEGAVFVDIYKENDEMDYPVASTEVSAGELEE